MASGGVEYLYESAVSRYNLLKPAKTQISSVGIVTAEICSGKFAKRIGRPEPSCPVAPDKQENYLPSGKHELLLSVYCLFRPPSGPFSKENIIIIALRAKCPGKKNFIFDRAGANQFNCDAVRAWA